MGLGRSMRASAWGALERVVDVGIGRDGEKAGHPGPDESRDFLLALQCRGVLFRHVWIKRGVAAVVRCIGLWLTVSVGQAWDLLCLGNGGASGHPAVGLP